MKLAKYWVRDRGDVVGRDGERITIVARGWSNASVDEARAKAREIAVRTAQRIADHPNERHQYGYGDRPMPEPVVRDFRPAQEAVVTRNAYGSLVLNADQLMFVDIDREDQPARIVDNATRVGQPLDLAGRVYQTAAGYRLIITNYAMPATPETEALLKQFGADPMYIRLCRMQQSFRARLTPKPWRCDAPKPPVQFPFESPRDEQRYRSWESEYNRQAADFATCRYIGSFGGIRIAPAFEDLVFYHDEETKASTQLPLA